MKQSTMNLQEAHNRALPGFGPGYVSLVRKKQHVRGAKNDARKAYHKTLGKVKRAVAAAVEKVTAPQTVKRAGWASWLGRLFGQR